MKKSLLIFLIVLPILVNAQKEPIKFGDVPPESFRMKVYNKDTSAVAVILADFGESTIDYMQSKSSWIVRFERVQRIKILKKEGSEWGDFNIPLYRDGNTEEELTMIKGITYNMEKGKVVESKLKNDAIFKEERDASWRMVKVAMPNVKEGSVIEITYRITSPFLFQFRSWEFQSTIPVLFSEYRARIPEYFEYKKLMQGYVPLLVNVTEQIQRSLTLEFREQIGGGNVSNRNGQTASYADREKIEYVENYSHWMVKDAPAFRDEPAMTTYRDYLSAISFELYSITMPGRPIRAFGKSWETVGDELLDQSAFGGLVKGSGFLKDYVEKVTAGVTDPQQKIGAIYSFVKNNMTWDGDYRVYPNENLRKAMDAKKGNSADINLILVSMLQKAGISAHPFLISTRSHGFIRKEYPRLGQFNTVLAGVLMDDKVLLLDATDRSLPASILPENYLNGEGLLVRNASSVWVKITPTKSRITGSATLAINADATVKGSLQLSYDGYFAQAERKKYARAGKDEYLKDFANEKHWEISTSTVENMEKLGEPIKETFAFQTSDFVQLAGDKMYLSPLLLMRVTANPFTSESRKYPVDFGGPEEKTYMAKITLPPGWIVEELPQSKVIVMPGNSAKCVFNATQSDNVISVTSQWVISRALFSPEEYSGLRDYYSQVVAKQAEQIVLKKSQ